MPEPAQVPAAEKEAVKLPWDANQLHYGLAWQIPLLSGGALSEGHRIAHAIARRAPQPADAAGPASAINE